MKLSIIDHQSRSTDQSRLAQIASRIWENEGEKDADILLILVDDSFITKLNREFFRKDNPTDVIAFQYSEPDAETLEGEVYISVDRVCDNAGYFKVAQADELNRVAAHGLLHLAGYRDETPQQKRQMTRLENRYLN